MSRFRQRHTTTDLEGKFTVNLQSNIGGGTYGTVYTCKNGLGETFAVKKLLHRLPNKEKCSGDEKENFERFRTELSTLKGQEHTYIAKLIDIIEGVQKNDWIVTEHCENGDLNKYLATETPDMERKLNIMLQCSRAVEHLHGLTPPLVHRDIKPGNVLLKSENGELWVKLTDLGLAKIYENHPDSDIKDEISEKCMIGSCYFMAPEIFEEREAWIYKEPVDVFALGLLFLVLYRHDRERLDGNRQIMPVSVQHLDKVTAAASILFYAEELITAMQEKAERPLLFTDDDTGPLQELIVKMTDYDPEKRPKAIEVVKKLQEISVQHQNQAKPTTSDPEDEVMTSMHDNDSGALQDMIENMANYCSEKETNIEEIVTALQNKMGPSGASNVAAIPKTNLETEKYALVPYTRLEKIYVDMHSFRDAFDEKNKIKMVTPMNENGNIELRGLHTGARPITNLSTESYVITPRVGHTKKNEDMASLPKAYDDKNKIEIVTPHNKRGKYDWTQNCKNILLIGETGSGKTTLVDGIYNYIRKVNWDEPNRYCVTGDEENDDRVNKHCQSTTDWITVYSLPTGQDFILNIVDTPGLADTRGVEKDESFKKRLTAFFQNSKGHGILTIDAVCCVWSSSENKLTAARRKIIESVISLFAIDIEKNMFCLACFADEFEPQVYDLINIPPRNRFKFNNGILFKGRGLESTWEWTMESYRQFFNYLTEIEPVSTRLTVKMLQQKTLLEQDISFMKESVQKHCELVLKHQHVLYQLNQNTEEQEESKIQTFSYIKFEVRNDPKKEALQCEKCDEMTCHYPCKQWDLTVFKYLFCERFGWSGKCKICKHSVLDHVKNKKHHYEIKRVAVERSIAELIEEYHEDEYTARNKEGLIKILEKLQEVNRKILIKAMVEIQNLSKDLHQIALYMPTKETIDEIIDDFIEEEEREKKDGYEDRVEIYKECKQEIAQNHATSSNQPRWFFKKDEC